MMKKNQKLKPIKILAISHLKEIVLQIMSQKRDVREFVL